MGTDPNELGSWFLITYDRVPIPDLRTVIPYRPHRSIDHKSKQTKYQQHRTFLRSMVESIFHLRLYYKYLLINFFGIEAIWGDT